MLKLILFTFASIINSIVGQSILPLPLFGPCQLPPRFPRGIHLSIQPYQTYGGEIKVPFAYLSKPRNSAEVIEISNWALEHGYKVRASGSRHSWAPFVFSMQEDGRVSSCPKTILVDTTAHFTSIMMMTPPPDSPENPININKNNDGLNGLYSVSVGTGVKLRKLLEFLESHGLGLFASPSFAHPTIGGMLATGAHGSGIPSSHHDSKSRGHTYGTISNLVISMTIVAWDEQKNSYTLKTLFRSHPDTKAFLTNLGRTFVTSVTLRVGRNQMLRSQSYFLLPSSELFAHPSKVREETRTISKFAVSYGRINAICLPPGNMFWLLAWHEEPIKPPKSRRTYGPFNYFWMNLYPPPLEPIYRTLTNRIPSVTKLVSVVGHPAIILGNRLSRADDYWGPSKNHLLYFTSNFPKMTAFPVTLLTSRRNIQLVLHIARTHFERLTREYEKLGQFPTPGEFDVRITGVDDPKDVEIEGAEAPSLSPARPIPEYPDFDTVIWIDMTAYKDTPHIYPFVTKLQECLYRDLHGRLAIMRVEWAKAWAFTNEGPWRNSTVMDHFSRTFSSSDAREEWNWAVNTFEKYDPHGIFSNAFLDELLSLK